MRVIGFAWMLLGLSGVAGMFGCAADRKAYVLRIQLSDPGVAKLCEQGMPSPGKATVGAAPKPVATKAPTAQPTTAPVAAADEPKPATPAPATTANESCTPYAGAPVAGTVAVSISGIDAGTGVSYALETQHKVIGGVSDPSEFFRLVFQHAFALTANATASLQNKAVTALDDKGVQVGAATDAVKERLTGLLGKRDAIGQGLAAALTDKRVAQPVEPAKLFRRYLDTSGTKPKLTTAPAKTSKWLWFGVSQPEPPPARMQAWEANRELAYAKDSHDPKTKLDLGSVVDHVETFCSPASFGPDPSEKLAVAITGGQPWAAFLATTDVDKLAVARALGFTDLDHLRNILHGRETAGIETQLAAAMEAETPTADQRQLLFAQQASILYDYVATCRHNVGVVATAVATDSKLAARITTLSTSLDEFAKHVESAGALFKTELAPFLVTAVVSVIQGTTNGDTVTFGPFELEGGKTNLTVKRKDASGEKDTASLVMRGDESVLGLGFSMGLGFAVSWCRSCTSEIVEGAEPSATGGSPTRVLTAQKRSVAFEPLITGQIDLLSWPSVSAGLVFGVPITDTKGRSDAVMFGAGVRLRNLVHLSAGVEAFSTRALPRDASGRERVELKDADQTLTADQVSHLETHYTFIFAMTIAKDLL